MFWSGFCIAESLVRRLSLSLACKPFPGLCVCTGTGRWCASVVATRSLTMSTDRADRCSQISSLGSWCATRVSKTLDVVHRYALLVSNSGSVRFGSVRLCCLMSPDIGWHIRDKLRPMPKHGSLWLYVHGNQKARLDGQPRTATSTLTQLLNYEQYGLSRSFLTKQQERDNRYSSST